MILVLMMIMPCQPPPIPVPAFLNLCTILLLPLQWFPEERSLVNGVGFHTPTPKPPFPLHNGVIFFAKLIDRGKVYLLPLYLFAFTFYKR